MSTDTFSIRRPPARLEADELEKKKKQERDTALIFSLLIGAFAALGIVLLANSSWRQGPSAASDCVSVEPTQARLACFDELARHSTPTPFKGSPPAQLDGKQ